jgi:hypothetical protein
MSMKLGVVRLSLVLLAAVVLGEILARLFLTSPSVQTFDPALGYANIPHGHSFQSREGFQRLTLNGLGLNDREIGAKPAGGTRVLFVGDSTTFSAQVARSDNFTSRLEAMTPGLDAVNAGRDALGPQQWAAMLDRLEGPVSPDAVVFVMSRGDAFDLQKAHATIAHDPAGRPLGVRYAEGHEDGLQKALGPLLRRSALATYLARRGQSVLTDTLTGDSWIGRLSRGRDNGGPVRRNSAADALDTARVTPQLADIMRLVSQGRRVAFVYAPSFVYGPNGQMTLEHRSLLERPAIEAAARQAGVTLIDLSPDFEAAYRRTGRPLTGFATSKLGEGHLNVEGQAVVADALHRRLVPLLLAPTLGAPD